MSKIIPTKSTSSPSSQADSPPAMVVEVYSQPNGQKVHWHVQTSWRQRIIGEGAPDWFNLKESDTAHRIKRGQGREVWRVKLGDEVVYAKISCRTRWPDKIKAILVGTTADREWRALLAASNRGVPVVEAIAVGRADRAALITLDFEGAIDLSQFWMELISQPSAQASARDIRGLVVGLAGFIADSHQRGFVHRDLHPANILVRRDAESGFEYRFVDLLGARLTRCEVGRSTAVRSLSQLHQFFGRVSSKTTRLRILRAYLSCLDSAVEGGAGRRLRRSWVASVSIQTATIAASLSSQRDRRLYRNGKYFAQWQSQGGWRGIITLALERRHIFPEPLITDFSKQAWSVILDEMLPNLSKCGEMQGSIEAAGLRWTYQRATSLMERLRWTWFGSPAKRLFIDNHHRRHRGQNAPLILGYFQHAWPVDLCVSVQAAAH